LGSPGRYANVTSRKQISRAGRPAADLGVAATGSAPASAITGSSRLSAITGAAAPSSAQLQPPNAIIDVPTSAVRYTVVWPSVCVPFAAALPIAHATSAFAAATIATLEPSLRSRNRVERHCSS
jgi:hypothetical protein